MEIIWKEQKRFIGVGVTFTRLVSVKAYKAKYSIKVAHERRIVKPLCLLCFVGAAGVGKGIFCFDVARDNSIHLACSVLPC